MARSLRRRAVRSRQLTVRRSGSVGLCSLWIGFALATTAPAHISAQSIDTTDDVPRTAWGAPDLQGVWNFRTPTPLERPEHLADQPTLSGAEAEDYLREILAAREEGRARAVNADFVYLGEELAGGGQTSLSVDPPNGRIPPRTGAGQKRQMTFGLGDGRRGSDNPEDRALTARCIIVRASPILPTPTGYNNNLQIFQTPDYVVVLLEMAHEALIVPLDGRPHLSGAIPQWTGDARGHWEGDTLVVERTNIHPQRTIGGSGPAVRVIERFTRTNAGTLHYEFTIDDPESFERPWSAVMPLTKRDDLLYEFACHEGNRSMTLLLEVARAQERRDGQSR